MPPPATDQATSREPRAPSRGRPRKRIGSPRPDDNLTPAQRREADGYEEWYMAAGHTQAEAAAMIGCSASTLSQIEAGTYAGDSGRYVRRMAAVRAREKARALAVKRPPYVVTSIAIRCTGVYELCRAGCKMGFICSSFGGVGKTMAAQEYARVHDDTIYIVMREKISHAGFLALLAKELEVDASGRCDETYEHILAKLRALGRPLLIIDDVDLCPARINIIRQIHDLAEVGIVIQCTPAFMAHLRRHSKGTEGQFLSRITYPVNLDGILEEDAELILRPFGLASASLQLVWSGCGRNARRAANIAIDAADRARTASADAISPHHIAAAVKATKLLDL